MVGLLNEIANCIGNMLKAISRLLHKLHCILCTVTNKIPVRGWGGGGWCKREGDIQWTSAKSNRTFQQWLGLAVKTWTSLHRIVNFPDAQRALIHCCCVH